LNALLDDVAGLAALDVDDEPDAARVVLVLGIVKSLSRGGCPARFAVSKLSHLPESSKNLTLEPSEGSKPPAMGFGGGPAYARREIISGKVRNEPL
jgi:hypothetical protein